MKGKLLLYHFPEHPKQPLNLLFTLVLLRFYPSKVKSCIEEVVMRNLKDKEYEHSTAKMMAETIAD